MSTRQKKVLFIVCLFALITNFVIADDPTPTQPSGSGTSAGDPYIITNLDEFYWMADQAKNHDNNFSGKYFRLNNNIDATATASWFSGAGWLPIGYYNSSSDYNYFQGSFDGQYSTISNLTINRASTDYVGLFGCTKEASISNFGISSGTIIGDELVGGLAGEIDNSTITNCFCSANVTGYSRIGCLVGQADTQGEATTVIDESYCTGDVTASSANAGGLVGRATVLVEINNCYSLGNVEAQNVSGGLVGDNHGSICCCYSIGAVNVSEINEGGLVGEDASGGYEDNFWNTTLNPDITGVGDITDPTGVTGATTTQMTNATTTNNIYLIAGWDFKGVGAEGIWNIGNGRNDGYPYLDWQYPGDTATLPVTLSAFTAQYIESIPVLSWTTQSETDNMGWFVYRGVENEFTTSEKISEFIEGHSTTTQQQSYIYEDNIENPKVGDTYYYWLESIDYSGIINHYDKVAQLIIPEIYDPGGGLVPVQEIYGLLQNEPNPFIESTKISFNLHKTAQVELNIYNLKGQLVKSLYSGMTSSQSLAWDGSDAAGQKLSAGVYLYKLIVNGKTEDVKKLILMR